MIKANDVGNCRNVFFVSEGFRNLLSVLKGVECTDCTAGFGRNALTFIVAHHG
jgi:hypothetical protein